MQYLKISNAGVIQKDNFVDIASSTKRFKYLINQKSLSLIKDDFILNDDEINILKTNLLNNSFLNENDLNSKLNYHLNNPNLELLQKYFKNRNIGFFGTGLKQAICYFLRENIKFRIFSSLDEIKITKEIKNSAGVYSDFLAVNGQVTNLNIAYGLGDYNLGMSISEIWTNAIDEGDYKLELVDENEILPELLRSVFYIEYNEDVEAFHKEWNLFFSFDRTDSIFKSTNQDDQTIEIFGNADETPFNNIIVYRRGIQVFVYPVPSIFHYRIDNLTITGSRVVKDKWEMDRFIFNCLGSKVPEKIVTSLLNGLTKYQDTYEFKLSWSNWMGSLGDAWKGALKNVKVVEAERVSIYKTQIKESLQPVYSIPSNLTSLLIDNDTGTHVNGDLSKHGRSGTVIEPRNFYSEQDVFLKQIEELVDVILDLKREDKNKDTKDLESQIDKLVYQLYDLSEEEIGIVEGLGK